MTRTKFLFMVVFSSFLFLPGFAFGDHAKVHGLLDVYGAYNFNTPPISTNLATSAQNNHRALDRGSRQFQVSQASIGLITDTKPVTFAATLGAGSQLDILNTVDGATDRTFANIRTATARWEESSYSLDVGRFDANFGFESIDSIDNWNYGRSFLFTLGQPRYYTGAQFGYRLSDSWTFNLAAANGVDRFSDNNIGKTYAVHLNEKLENHNHGFSYTGGPEKAGDSKSWRHTVGYHYQHHFSSSTEGGLDALYASGQNEVVNSSTNATSNAKWFGAAVYGHFAIFSDSWDTLRIEWLRDKDGAATKAGSGRSLWEVTLTHRAEVTKNFSLWFEGRYDNATSATFNDSTGLARNFKKNQATLLAAATFNL